MSLALVLLISLQLYVAHIHSGLHVARNLNQQQCWMAFQSMWIISEVHETHIACITCLFIYNQLRKNRRRGWTQPDPFPAADSIVISRSTTWPQSVRLRDAEPEPWEEYELRLSQPSHTSVHGNNAEHVINLPSNDLSAPHPSPPRTGCFCVSQRSGQNETRNPRITLLPDFQCALWSLLSMHVK